MPNAKKQAEQLRYCLTQAKEYYDAALSVSLATRPVLMYYSMMSLALSEILMKQDGRCSLDMARSDNAHHGLSFSIVDQNPQPQVLLEQASRLRAKPLVKNGRGFGTFALWHRSSREAPILGKREVKRGFESTTSYNSILNPDDKQFNPISESGVSFLDCIQRLPTMLDFVHSHGVKSFIMRASVTDLHVNDSVEIKILVHPCDYPDVLNDFSNKIKICAGDISLVDIREFSVGFLLTISGSRNSFPNFVIPQGATISKEQVRFFSHDISLNEFGLFYVVIYLAGNYARYFPDLWLRELDSSTPFALAVEELLYQAEQRVPLLMYSELAGNYFVPN